MRPNLLFFVTVAIILLTCSAFAQNVEYAGSAFWSEISDVKVVGDYAYCAFTNGLVVLNVTDPATPSFVSKLHLPGEASGIDVAGSYAYIAGARSGINIVNITNPANPSLVASYDTPGSANKVFISGNYAYVADGDSGIQIINISDPANPALAGSYNNEIRIDKIFVVGNYAYTAQGQYGYWDSDMAIINISDPANPVLVGSYVGDDNHNQINDLFVLSNYAYIVDEYFRILDISDPTNPILLSSYSTAAANMGISVVGNYAYLARYSMFGEWIYVPPALLVLDVADPANPVPFDSLVVPEPADVFVEGNYAFMPTNRNPYHSEWGVAGLKVINVSDPANLILSGSYDTPGEVNDVFVQDSYAYVAAVEYGLRILDISGPGNPVEVGRYQTPDSLPPDISRVFVQGSYAYTLAEDHLLTEYPAMLIINISDPQIPTYTGSYRGQFGSSWHGIYIQGDYAYLVKTSGIEILNILDRANPIRVGFASILHIGRDVVVRGDYAYATHVYGLKIFNIADPANPTVEGACNLSGGNPTVSIQGNYAYIAHQALGLQVIDITDPSNPILADSAGIPGTEVFAQGNYAYLANDYGGLTIVDISDPVNPVTADDYNTPGHAKNVFVSGDYIYVADGTSLQILRFNPTGIEDSERIPEAFSLPQNYPNPFNARTVISYSLPKSGDVTIDIFDILGRKIETLAEGMKPAGEHQANWDAGSQSSGIYFYRIKAGGKVETKKMVLMK